MLYDGKTHQIKIWSNFSIYEDKRGNLWICSGFLTHKDVGGLNLYNPTTESFIRYQHDPNDPTSLRTNAVLSTFEDSKGNFWVGTVNDGLHLMNREKGTLLKGKEREREVSPIRISSYDDNQYPSVQNAPLYAFFASVCLA